MILSWDGIDPKTIYAEQLASNPMYWNENLNVWEIYSYSLCKELLTNPLAQIPVITNPHAHLLSNRATVLLEKIARLSNGGQHAQSREAAMVIYNSMRKIPVGDVLEGLIAEVNNTADFDWVAIVCKKLPAMLIVKGLGFGEEDCRYVIENIYVLVKIISPHKTIDDIELINEVIGRVYTLAEKAIAERKSFDLIPNTTIDENDELVELLVCNLIGLLIQCYDAGRGLLCNALMSMLQQKQNDDRPDLNYFQKLVTETLRFTPPVHHTRRVAVEDIVIGGGLIKAGQNILIVMAAANLDEAVFANPILFDVWRSNSDAHLTFGAGGHICLAKYFCLDMAAEMLDYVVHRYPNINIAKQELEYEPQLNVRLIKSLKVKLQGDG